VTSKFVFSVERSLARFASERFLRAVYDHMDFQIMIGLEAFAASIALVLPHCAMCRQMTSEISFACEHLITVGARIGVRGGLEVVLESRRCRVLVITLHTTKVFGTRFGTLIWIKAVRVLVRSEFLKRGKLFIADVASVAHLVLVLLDVVQENIQIAETLTARVHNTLVHLFVLVHNHVRLELEVREKPLVAILADV
jgi:hypothetical protein